jgi:hypothetical protein
MKRGRATKTGTR